MKQFITGFLKWLKMFPRYVFAGYSKSKHLKDIKQVMGNYDMMKAPSEDYFKERYLEMINEIINQNFRHGISLRILDAGCGQGRIAIELAKMGHTVDAMDYVEETIEKGKKYAEEMLPNASINWKTGKIPDDLSFYQDEAYDMVLCLEVLYMMSHDECCKSLQELAKKVKKGGMLMISVRPRYYYLGYYLINRDFLRLQHVAKNLDFSELGQYLSWTDKSLMEEIFRNLGFENINAKGLGILTGIQGDPTALFCRPELLSENEKRIVAEVENTYSSSYPEAGRYIVFWATKR